MSPSPEVQTQKRGYVIAIGGAEDRTGATEILGKFLRLCGGKKARIVIIPTASTLEDTGNKYEEIFDNIGAATTTSLPIFDRADGEREDYLEQLDEADGIFITGGNQLRLSTILGGTAIAQRIRRLNAMGTPVAGTSAGAAIMPEHMISGGTTGTTPYKDSVNLSPGFGLTNAVIIDQHFSQRDRLGRLLAAISYNPFMVGVGIDEDTAIFIDHAQRFTVVGSGSVTVVDPAELSYSSMSQGAPKSSLSLLNLKLHILSKGCQYDLIERTAFQPNQK